MGDQPARQQGGLEAGIGGGRQRRAARPDAGLAVAGHDAREGRRGQVGKEGRADQGCGFGGLPLMEARQGRLNGAGERQAGAAAFGGEAPGRVEAGEGDVAARREAVPEMPVPAGDEALGMPRDNSQRVKDVVAALGERYV